MQTARLVSELFFCSGVSNAVLLHMKGSEKLIVAGLIRFFPIGAGLAFQNMSGHALYSQQDVISRDLIIVGPEFTRASLSLKLLIEHVVG